jgi:broad specificity phosphatase PhoE
MMRHLILVKHALPEIDPALPAHRWPLSVEGRRRCHTLAERLADYSPGCMLSSREPKAVETAQLLADHFGQTVEIVEGLHEHDRSDVGWMDEARFRSQVQAFFDQPDRLVMGRETAAQARKRFARAVTAALGQCPRGDVVIVAHGTVITLFVEQAVGVAGFEFWKQLGLPSMVVLSLPELALVRGPI